MGKRQLIEPCKLDVCGGKEKQNKTGEVTAI